MSRNPAIIDNAAATMTYAITETIKHGINSEFDKFKVELTDKFNRVVDRYRDEVIKNLTVQSDKDPAGNLIFGFSVKVDEAKLRQDLRKTMGFSQSM